MKKIYFSILCFTILILNCDSNNNRWEKTKAIHTIQSYTEFINKYPDSKFYPFAIDAIDSINYSKADSIGTLAAYKKFINDFPKSKYLESIKKKFRKVTFMLFQFQKPFANEEIAIFPVVNDHIGPIELGFGKTDSKGNTTIEFVNTYGYTNGFTKFVLIGRSEGTYLLLRHHGSALTFKCDEHNIPCDLGKLVFETFEITLH